MHLICSNMHTETNGTRNSLKQTDDKIGIWEWPFIERQAKWNPSQMIDWAWIVPGTQMGVIDKSFHHWTRNCTWWMTCLCSFCESFERYPNISQRVELTILSDELYFCCQRDCQKLRIVKRQINANYSAGLICNIQRDPSLVVEEQT